MKERKPVLKAKEYDYLEGKKRYACRHDGYVFVEMVGCLNNLGVWSYSDGKRVGELLTDTLYSYQSTDERLPRKMLYVDSKRS